MKPKPFPYRIPGQREEPMAPPGWWRRLMRWRREAKALRQNRIWGMWEAMSPALKERYMLRHEGKRPVRVAPVYPREPVCHAVRHRRTIRGRIKERSYR